MQGGILSTTRLHQSRCLSLNAPTLTPRALSLRQNLHSFGPPFSICAVSPAGLQALGGQLPYLLPLLLSQQCQAQGEAPRECLAVQEPHLTSPSGCTRWGPRG